jgi:hypothetical protein
VSASGRRLATACGVLGILSLATGTAGAQAAPRPDPAPLSPSPQHLQLSADEQELLARGEISAAEHIGGGIAGALVGFGLGQALQGRWTERGWLFTLGDTAAAVAVFWGGTRIASHCPAGEASGCDDPGVALAIGGALTLSALRIWQTLDAAIVPVAHNRRVRELRTRDERQSTAPGHAVVQPWILPARGGDGLMGGVCLRF